MNLIKLLHKYEGMLVEIEKITGNKSVLLAFI